MGMGMAVCLPHFGGWYKDLKNLHSLFFRTCCLFCTFDLSCERCVKSARMTILSLEMG